MTKILALITMFLIMLTGCTSPTTQAQAPTTQAPISTPTQASTEPTTQAPTPAPTPTQDAPTEPLIQAPSAARVQTYQQPALTATQPAPVRAAQPKPAPVQQVSVPVAPVVPATPIETVTPTPIRCEEDMPCWDCNTMGNKICGPVGTVDCENLKLGDAYMGIMPHCYMVEASKLYPSPANFSAAYLGSDQSKAPCANYTIPSKMYPGVTHYFTDGTPVAGCTS